MWCSRGDKRGCHQLAGDIQSHENDWKKWLERPSVGSVFQSCAVVNQEPAGLYSNLTTLQFSTPSTRQEELSDQLPHCFAGMKSWWSLHYADNVLKISELTGVWLGLSAVMTLAYVPPLISWLHSWQKLRRDMDVTWSLGLRYVTHLPDKRAHDVIQALHNISAT